MVPASVGMGMGMGNQVCRDVEGCEGTCGGMWGKCAGCRSQPKSQGYKPWCAICTLKCLTYFRHPLPKRPGGKKRPTLLPIPPQDARRKMAHTVWAAASRRLVAEQRGCPLSSPHTTSHTPDSALLPPPPPPSTPTLTGPESARPALAARFK